MNEYHGYGVGARDADGLGVGDGDGDGGGVGGGDGCSGGSCSICGMAHAVYSVTVSATFAHQYDRQFDSLIGAAPSPLW
jgi:hypothetical protein